MRPASMLVVVLVLGVVTSFHDDKQYSASYYDTMHDNFGYVKEVKIKECKCSGPTGEKGLPGVKGMIGQKGEQGEKGETGPPGMKGMKGMKGMTGPVGDKGMKGDTGMKGNDGLPPQCHLEVKLTCYSKDITIDPYYGDATWSEEKQTCFVKGGATPDTVKFLLTIRGLQGKAPVASKDGSSYSSYNDNVYPVKIICSVHDDHKQIGVHRFNTIGNAFTVGHLQGTIKQTVGNWVAYFDYGGPSMGTVSSKDSLPQSSVFQLQGVSSVETEIVLQGYISAPYSGYAPSNGILVATGFYIPNLHVP